MGLGRNPEGLLTQSGKMWMMTHLGQHVASCLQDNFAVIKGQDPIHHFAQV